MEWEWIYLKLPPTVILTVKKPLIFSSLKSSLQLRVNNLATTTALKGKSYVPVRKINIFVDIGVKVRGLIAKASTLFSAPL